MKAAPEAECGNVASISLHLDTKRRVNLQRSKFKVQYLEEIRSFAGILLMKPASFLI